MHTCPLVNPGPVPHVGGPIITGFPTVLTVGLPQARVSDMMTCVGPPDAIARGSASVFVGGMPAARIGDNSMHGGVIVSGAPTVLIGDAGCGGSGAGAGSAGGGAGAGGKASNPASAASSGAADGPAAQDAPPSADLPCMKKAAKGGSAFVRVK